MKRLIYTTGLFLLTIHCFSQSELRFYTKKPKQKYSLKIDSVYITYIQNNNDSILNYIPLGRIGQNNFHHYYFEPYQKYNYVIIIRNNHRQGIYLGEINDKFFKVDFVIDTLKVFNYPNINSSIVKINYLYSDGKKHKGKAISEPKKYYHWANAYLSEHTEESKFMNLIDNYIFMVNKKSAVFIQGHYSMNYSMNFYGLQLKRQSGIADIGYAKYNDQELSISFSNRLNQKFISFDANTGLLFFPYTLGLTLGGGINYTTTLNCTDQIFSVYPKISISAGGITVYYSYKFPIIDKLRYNYGHHGLTIAFGPKIWSKNDDN